VQLTFLTFIDNFSTGSGAARRLTKGEFNKLFLVHFRGRLIETMRTNNIYPAIYIFSVSDQVVIVLWLHFGQRGGMPWSTGFRQVARCGNTRVVYT